MNFMAGVEGNATSSPERLISGFDAKRNKLTESIADLQDQVNREQHARSLNTIRAYKDSSLGPKMQELSELNDQLKELDETWIGIGGDKLDDAREMIAVKQAYDSLEAAETPVEEEEAGSDEVESSPTVETTETPEEAGEEASGEDQYKVARLMMTNTA